VWIVRSSRDVLTPPNLLGEWRHEDHDRAQDAFVNEKLARPTNIVEMSEKGAEVLFVIYSDDKPDSIFSHRMDAEAWADQLWHRFGAEHLRIEAIPSPSLSWSTPPVKEAPTIWERLLSQEDEDL